MTDAAYASKYDGQDVYEEEEEEEEEDDCGAGTPLEAVKSMVGKAGGKLLQDVQSRYEQNAPQLQIIIELLRQIHEYRIDLPSVESEMESNFPNDLALKYIELVTEECREVEEIAKKKASSTQESEALPSKISEDAVEFILGFEL